MKMFLIMLMAAAIMTPDSVHAQFAWRGRPLPECRQFLITESGLYAGYEIGLKGDLGIMTNISPGSALGGSLHGMFGGDIETNYGTVGISGRYRSWWNRNWSIDVAPRIQWTKRDDLNEWNGPSLGCSTTIGYGDLIGLGACAVEPQAVFDLIPAPVALDAGAGCHF